MLIVTSINQLGADEPPVTKGSTCRELVQHLASPNKRPTADMDGVTLPPGYDVAAQQRIAAARKQLCENVEAALPFLIDALDDMRYCMTIDWADGDLLLQTVLVGSICREVIASHLEVYRTEIRFSGPQHWNRYNYKPISKEWWIERKDRNLAELQIEAINWAIEKRQTEEDADKLEHRRDEVARLQKLRDDIAKTGKPVEPRRMLPMVISNK